VRRLVAYRLTVRRLMISVMTPQTSFEYGKLKELFQKPWIQIVILASFCFLLFVLGVGRWDLWDPDEPRYAEVAKEMVMNSGDWILMHLNGRVYGDKPPLFFWLIALSSYLWGGFTSFAVRFPAALFGTLTVLLTFFLGRSLYSSRTGLVSGFILATSLEFTYLSTRANIDTTLTFFTTASIFCFLLWVRHRKEKEAYDDPMGGLAFLGFYVGMGLATLAKGPVGFIIPLLVSLIYLAVQKDWKGIRRMRLMTGMLLFLVIVLFWYLPAVISGGKAYLQETLFKHTVDAYAKGWTHVNPFYYYFLNFPLDFLPWTLFLPALVCFKISKGKEGIGREFLFLLVWFVSIFLFFSFSKGKRPIYLLPLYPAAAVMVGNFWDEYISGPSWGSKKGVWISIPIYVLAALLFLTGTVLYFTPVVAGFTVDPHASKLLGTILKAARTAAKYLSYVPYKIYVPLFFLVLGSSILFLVAQRLKRRSMVFVLIVLTVGIAFFYGTRFMFPMIDPYKSARFLSQEVQQAMKPGDKLAMYGGFAIGPYNFYTGIVPIADIESNDEMVSFFRSRERVFCLIQDHEFEALKKKDLGIPLYLITRRKVGSKDIVLVSNQ
jgi:4-amino-4-deoxy-L-arabinose transferase-like glycosyltransferase